MEYEIYLLCNILGIIILFLIIVFHFIDADHDNAKSFIKESNSIDEGQKVDNLKRNQQKPKKEKKKLK